MQEFIKLLSGPGGWQFLAQFLLLLGAVGSGFYVILERAYKQRISFLKETVEEYKSTINERVERKTSELENKVNDLEASSGDFNALLTASIELLVFQFGDIIIGGHLDEFLRKGLELNGSGKKDIEDEKEKLIEFFNGVYHLAQRYDNNMAKYKMRDIRQSLIEQKLI
jgi:hypothetical protein